MTKGSTMPAAAEERRAAEGSTLPAASINFANGSTMPAIANKNKMDNGRYDADGSRDGCDSNMNIAVQANKHGEHAQFREQRTVNSRRH